MRLTLNEIIGQLSQGQISSLELVQEYLRKIENSKLNAFITINKDPALAAAASPKPGVLSGVPIAYKDNVCTKGLTTSCASKMLSNFTAPYDATIFQKLSAAGSINLGKTNMDEFAMGSSNESSYYGTVRNPWDLSKVAGGSSGGSAAAVAAGLVPVAIGSDTGGSVRQPAAHCGIYGLKPTYGRISRFGMVAYASSLDQPGILGLCAKDCALMLELMAGVDPRDATSIDVPVPKYSDLGSVAGKKIGVIRDFIKQLSSPLQEIFNSSIAEFERQGANIVEIKLDHVDLAVPTYYIIAMAEASSNLSRFDGVRYGYSHPDPGDLEELYTKTRGDGFGMEVKRRILLGTYLLSSGYYDAYYQKAQKIRRLISQTYAKAFTQVDLLLSPVTPSTAFGIGEKVNDPLSMYLSDIFTIGVNLAGLPALAFPIGQLEGMPVGAQLIGPHFKENLILDAAHSFEQVTDWHKMEPKGE